jgi:hypothetical protein
MSDNDLSAADPFEHIVDEFEEAFRQGKRPSVEEFARRYPEHADNMRGVLPALALMEQAKSAEDTPRSTAPARRGGQRQLRGLPDPARAGPRRQGPRII